MLLHLRRVWCELVIGHVDYRVLRLEYTTISLCVFLGKGGIGHENSVVL